MFPSSGYRKKKLAWSNFKKIYWKVKLGPLSYKLTNRCFADRNALLMVDYLK